MKWIYSLRGIFLVLFLLSLSMFSYSLSEEEKKILPDLSKDVLIQIILVQNEGLEASELTILELERLRLEDSKLLKIQTELFQKSLQMQKEKDAQTIKNYIKIGGVSFSIGAIATAIYMYQK